MPGNRAASRIVFVILNPASSHGAAGRIRPRVELALRRLDIDFELRVTERPGHAAELAARAADRGREAILVVGGDGTVHEVANGLLVRGADPPPLGVVPVGTGNDFYRMVGTPRDVDAAVALLRTGAVRRFDVGRARWDGTLRYFVNLLGIGIDTEVLRQRGRFTSLPGLAQYFAALVTALARFRPLGLRVRVDDEPALEHRALIAAITVGPSAGGGFRLTPGAVPDDGHLDLCFVEELSATRIVRYLPKVVRGRHVGLAGVHMRRFCRGSVESLAGEPFLFEMDGELTACVSRLDVELLPGRLPVLTPAPRS